LFCDCHSSCFTTVCYNRSHDRFIYLQFTGSIQILFINSLEFLVKLPSCASYNTSFINFWPLFVSPWLIFLILKPHFFRLFQTSSFPKSQFLDSETATWEVLNHIVLKRISCKWWPLLSIHCCRRILIFRITLSTL